MQRYSLSLTWERIRYRISDSLSYNKLAYFIYFAIIVIGAVLGVLVGKDIPLLYDVSVKNQLTAILYENSGIFSAFFAGLVYYLILFAFCVVGVFSFPFVIFSFGFCGLISFLSFRNGICLIVLGGMENVLCGILFYLIQYLVFLVAVSYTVIKALVCYKNMKYCRFNLGDSLRCVAPSFILALLVTLLYSVILSLIISFFAI